MYDLESARATPMDLLIHQSLTFITVGYATCYHFYNPYTTDDTLLRLTNRFMTGVVIPANFYIFTIVYFELYYITSYLYVSIIATITNGLQTFLQILYFNNDSFNIEKKNILNFAVSDPLVIMFFGTIT
eukprot:UN06655